MAKFKENANMFSIVDETKAPIIHGHTRIDLRDVKTGKRERIESDNTFMATTLAKYMRGLGAGNNNPFANDTWKANNMVKNLCGGVFLFKDVIPDNSEYMPAGNKMTANGCYNVVNNGNPPEFGSWNSIESNIDGNSSAVLVWDWSTSQGNGQISSVCLTSETGGYIGYGNASGYAMSIQRGLYANQNLPMIGRAKTIYSNMRYVFEYTSPILTVSRYRASITQGSIFDKKLKSVSTFDLSTMSFASTPTSLNAIAIDNDKVMIRRSDITNIADNSAFEFLIYDPSDNSLTLKSIVNTIGTTFDSRKTAYFSEEDRLIIGSNTEPDHVYVCNGQTGAIVKNFEFPKRIRYFFVKFQENLFGNNGYVNMFDLVNGTAYPTNGISEEFYVGSYNKQYDCFFANTADPLQLTLPDAWGIRVYKNPLYLATINNLQESVTKQNTQTMKVTYTLTEV